MAQAHTACALWQVNAGLQMHPSRRQRGVGEAHGRRSATCEGGRRGKGYYAYRREGGLEQRGWQELDGALCCGVVVWWCGDVMV